MPVLSFSEFAQMLYPYCGKGETRPKFVIKLFDNIIGGQHARAKKMQPTSEKDEGYKNPMRNKSDRTLQSYYSGSRAIAQRDASAVVAGIKRYKFVQYLNQFSEDALTLVKNRMNELMPNSKFDYKTDIASECAELFEAILNECASRTK